MDNDKSLKIGISRAMYSCPCASQSRSIAFQKYLKLAECHAKVDARPSLLLFRIVVHPGLDQSL